jgi:hypothetical protein
MYVRRREFQEPPRRESLAAAIALGAIWPHTRKTGAGRIARRSGQENDQVAWAGSQPMAGSCAQAVQKLCST